MNHQMQNDLRVESSVEAISARQEGLVIQADQGGVLSPAQVAFNRLMKQLEAARTKHGREEVVLDKLLAISIREWMPMIEELNRLDRDMIFGGARALKTLKLSAKRRHWFEDLLLDKSYQLLDEPSGLSEEDVQQLEAFIDALVPKENDAGGEDEDAPMSAEELEEFEILREALEQAAKSAGVDLDLSGIGPGLSQKEFQRQVHARVDEANARGGVGTQPKRERKPTKAALEKERKRQEVEEMKNRDFKVLFKQLAKAFHPDLETDPVLKQHKEILMKRLNAAYASKDLREMLQLEMEWLGEEATHLATAGEEKLKVFCMVLKEQIDDLKRQTARLIMEPRYGSLLRFISPYQRAKPIPANVKRKLQERVEHNRHLRDTILSNTAASRKLIEKWAGGNARAHGY